MKDKTITELVEERFKENGYHLIKRNIVHVVKDVVLMTAERVSVKEAIDELIPIEH